MVEQIYTLRNSVETKLDSPPLFVAIGWKWNTQSGVVFPQRFAVYTMKVRLALFQRLHSGTKSLHFRPQNVEIFDFFVQKPVLCEQPLYFLSVIILCWLTTAKKKTVNWRNCSFKHCGEAGCNMTGLTRPSRSPATVINCNRHRLCALIHFILHSSSQSLLILFIQL